MPAEALRFLDSMIESGYLPHIESYRHIICSLCEEGSIKIAKQVFCDMLTKEYNYDEIVWRF
jgi:pentatricopeptide repeat protein